MPLLPPLPFPPLLFLVSMLPRLLLLLLLLRPPPHQAGRSGEQLSRSLRNSSLQSRQQTRTLQPQ